MVSEGAALHLVSAVGTLEVFPAFLVRKERGEAGRLFSSQSHSTLGSFDKFRQHHGGPPVRGQRSASGVDELGVFGKNYLAWLELESLNEPFPQF